MLKVHIALIALLIACVAFMSCDRGQKMLQPVADDMMAADDMMKMMTDMMDSTMYMSWASVELPAPTMTVAEAAAAMNAAGTGAAHGEGTRTAYINDIGAMANMDGTAYPAGTIIVKTIMDDANTFVAKKAVMTKTDDPMYADHNGWMYVKYARSSADGEYMMVGGGSLENSMGCHGCHAKADNDSVFVSFSMDDMMDEMDDMDDANGGAADEGNANGGDVQ
ncbi:cytochrome P460 family protein [Candidatus Poribacteria bacterium]|nr:cytochrome P460 family protein [Candidatus Poribacteria bacterium]